MKREWLTTAIIIAFLGIVLFGVMGVSSMTGHGEGCIFESLNAAICPTEAFSYAIYHMGALLSLSAVPLALALILALLFVFALLSGLGTVFRPQPAYAFSIRIERISDSSQRRQLQSALALLEHSPTTV